jgi:hypothetical protein
MNIDGKILNKKLTNQIQQHLTTIKKIIPHDQGLISGMQRCFTTIIQHIHKIKDKMCLISTHTGKAFEKFNVPS